MRYPDEPELTEQDKRAIEAIKLELDRELGPPWPEAAPPTGGPLASSAPAPVAAASSARPSRGLRLALGAGITTLAAAIVAAVVSLVDVGSLIAPPRSASLHRSAPATRSAPPVFTDPEPSAIETPPVPAQPVVERPLPESPRLTSRVRSVWRGGDGRDDGRSSGAPTYRRPVGSQPPRDERTMTTRYRTDRAPESARPTERVGYVQAP